MHICTRLERFKNPQAYDFDLYLIIMAYEISFIALLNSLIDECTYVVIQ